MNQPHTFLPMAPRDTPMPPEYTARDSGPGILMALIGGAAITCAGLSACAFRWADTPAGLFFAALALGGIALTLAFGE